MPDSATATQEGTTTEAPPPGAQGNSPPAPKTEAKPPDSPPAQDNEDFDLDDWIEKNSELTKGQKAHIRKLRSQNAKRKEELSEAKTKLADYEKEKREAQRKADEEAGNYKKIAEEQRAQLEAKNQRIIRAEAKAAAVREGMVDPSLLDELPLKELSLNEDGEVIGLDKWMDAMKKNRSYLFEKSDKKPAGTTSEKKPPAPNPSTKAKSALEMSPEEFEAAKADFLTEERKKGYRY